MIFSPILAGFQQREKTSAHAYPIQRASSFPQQLIDLSKKKRYFADSTPVSPASTRVYHVFEV